MTRSATQEPSWDPIRDALLKPGFRADLDFWIGSEPRVARRIMRLVEDVLRSPRSGMGKPEPLRHAERNVWSRRITAEHRFIYQISDQGPLFVRARYHY